jgi:Domain of unknown function (DUF4371)
VLRRVVGVIKFLATREMAFRGNNEFLGSPHNGNFLDRIELLAQLDPFLENPLNQYANAYLSSTIVEELIQLLAYKVHETILLELTKAKYISAPVDSTPDLNYMDQLTVIVGYLLLGEPVKRVLTFFNLKVTRPIVLHIICCSTSEKKL